MKTVKDYFREFLQSSGWSSLDHLPDSYINSLEKAVSAIRADALAEKPPATDANEEREWKRFVAVHKQQTGDCPSFSDAFKKLINAYAATFPPRPMRTPGQRLADALREVDFMSGKLSDCAEAKFERAATALGIQPAP